MAGADRPYRLVRHNQLRGLLIGQVPRHVVHLADREIELYAFAPFLVAFSDAKYRLHAGSKHGPHLVDDVRVVFGMVFGVVPNGRRSRTSSRDGRSYRRRRSPVNAPCEVTETAWAP